MLCFILYLITKMLKMPLNWQPKLIKIHAHHINRKNKDKNSIKCQKNLNSLLGFLITLKIHTLLKKHEKRLKILGYKDI